MTNANRCPSKPPLSVVPNRKFATNILLARFSILGVTALLAGLLLMSAAADAPAEKGREQWPVAKAWAWNDKVGVIRGFNALGLAYPGMSDEEVMRKAQSLGYNSLRVGDYFRLWLRSPDEAKQRLRATLEKAHTNGLTVAPVMIWGSGSVPGGTKGLQDPDAKRWGELRDFIHDMVGEFRNDDRIVLWDVFNEPGMDEGSSLDLQVAKKLILWAREVNPSQPLTSSVLYTGPEPSPDRIEVEQLADIHNFHLYDCSTNQMTNIADMIECIKRISDRPIVCTECLARPRGDTFGRILPAFSKYHVHWYNWGLYTGDANWAVSWRRSAFDPHEPWFHDVLHPDGDPYDWRDLGLIRNFHFAAAGENPEPGVEITDRWLKEKAWQWFFLGPVRGRTYRPSGINSWDALWQTDATNLPAISDDLVKAQQLGCDGLRVRFSYTAWEADSNQFCKRVEEFLSLADSHGMSVMPVLLTDADATHPAQELAGYVRNVIKTFGRDRRVYCWDLYYHPGEGGLRREQARTLLREIFQTARFEFPGQPLTATPAVRVDSFPPDFDYRKALAHQGGLGNNGWNKLQYAGSGDASLCAYIWGLSDVLSIASAQSAPETGWLLSVANRYGRPVICAEWSPSDATAVGDTLTLFSRHHVRWYSTGSNVSVADGLARQRNPLEKLSALQADGLLDPQVLEGDENLSRLVKQFQYQRVMTPRQ
jgi:hypothetical protein